MHSFPVLCFAFGLFGVILMYYPFVYSFSLGVMFKKGFLTPKTHKYYSGVLGHYYRSVVVHILSITRVLF